MKKLLLLTCVLMLSFGGTLFAQEEFPNGEFLIWKDAPWSLGGCFEYGMNSREIFAPGYGVSIGRYLGTPLLALGLRGNMHNDGISITATEIQLNFRAYVVPIADTAALNVSLFTQWGFGAAFYSEEGRERNTYTTDFAAGCRMYFYKGFLRGFYVEPYVRGGFPFIFSGGISAGHWFNF
jgi:hypothetical protein